MTAPSGSSEPADSGEGPTPQPVTERVGANAASGEATVVASEPPVPPEVPAAVALDPPRRLGRVEGFDGLRGLMLIVVVVAHMSVLIPVGRLLVIPGGTVALDSFFVLSGFLITVMLLREQKGTGRVDAPAFYQRRALRLLPALVLLLVVHAIYASLTNLPGGVERSSLTSVIFYYSNYKLASGPQSIVGGSAFAAGLGHLWSLSVEEQFYLIWPIVVILLLGAKRRLSTVVTVLVSLIAAVAIWRFVSYHGVSSYYPLFVRTDYRADAMLWGALLAHLWIRDREPKRGLHIAAWFAALFMAWCLAFVDELGPFLYKGGFLLIDFSCAVIILAIVQGRWAGQHIFRWKPFVILGTVSYGFYLWHAPVFLAVGRYTPTWPWPARVAVALAITAAFTAISWFGLERWALKWKRKTTPVPAPADGASGGGPGDASPVPAPADVVSEDGSVDPTGSSGQQDHLRA